ncbi:hypothetical protein [Clostridium thermarum]|uniref:hypothetical protein n=2 Tax=Clostridium thermarum TaxID=1716543 RepID=UPI001122B94C|nr:hypothetical protein [Clostridium thermarum]
MVSSSCKKLSRLELIYSVNSRFIKELKEVNESLIPQDCLVYLEKGHKNDTIYRTQDSQADSKLSMLLKHSLALLEVCSQAGETVTNLDSYQLLIRMLGDHTDKDSNNNITGKAGKDISSTSLQNPTDPDATYRKKYGDNTGYVVNVVEAFNDVTGGIITN